MRAFLWIVGLVVVAALARMAWVMVPVSGVLDRLEPKLAETCSRVDIHPGTEDVTIDPDTGTVYVSAYDRRDPSGPDGGIWAFSLKDQTPRLVSTDAPAGFRPHGISLWRGPDMKRLFAISHPPDGTHVVEIFDVTGDGLTHVGSVSFEAMYSPNDLVAVGPEQFYATNDQRFEDGLLSQLEIYLGLPLTSVVYWDGQDGRVAATGLAFANGINASADGRTIYVASFLGRRIAVYARDPETGDLTHVKDLPVPTNPDNIEVAADGSLYIGAHPKPFEFLAHAEDPAKTAPAQVIRLDPETGEVEEVLVAVDGILSGSSVGAVHDGVLVVGAVFDPHVLVCPLPETGG